MNRIVPNIIVDGCHEALVFYQELFGGEVKNLQLTDGNEMFKGHEGKIIHAELHINPNCVLYLNDLFGDKSQGSNVNLILELDSEQEIKRIYTVLANKGRVQYELQKAFWGAFHAIATDQFGVTWSLNYAIK